MTVKLALLKSGEDVIADIAEMVVDEKVVGYVFDQPGAVKLITGPLIVPLTHATNRVKNV